MRQLLSKKYRDDEYYTTQEAAEKFFQKVVAPSGILKHKTIIMPFTKAGTPLHEAAEQYHGNVIAFNGDTEMWQQVNSYDDAAVIDNPPFSLSTKIEQFYINENVPFVIFRSAVSYPLFIYREEHAGVIYEDSRRGVQFDWGFAEHIAHDKYIHSHYPNLIDNLKEKGILSKSVPVGFSFYLVDYQFKIKQLHSIV